LRPGKTGIRIGIRLATIWILVDEIL